MSALYCGVPGCRTVIRAMTGFQEVEKLRRHLERAHNMRPTLAEAAEWRARFEDQAQPTKAEVPTPTVPRGEQE